MNEGVKFGYGSYYVYVDKFGDIHLHINSEQIDVKSWIMHEEATELIEALRKAIDISEKMESKE